jgi:hypothetical protein
MPFASIGMLGCVPPDPCGPETQRYSAACWPWISGPAASAPGDSARGEAIQHDEIAAHAAHRKKDAGGAHCEPPSGSLMERCSTERDFGSHRSPNHCVTAILELARRRSALDLFQRPAHR